MNFKLFACQGNMRFLVAVSIFFWTGLLLPGKLHAQRDSLKTTVLKEVGIIKSKREKIFKSPASLQILNGKDLERLNAVSVADAVRYFSGVQIKDYGGVGGLKTINVRSMGSNHTAVYYDGIQLGNAQNGQIDLGKFSLENVEEIALYSGQRDELLQPARAFASASSLYIKTITPSFLNKKTNIRAGVKSGSFGLINSSFSVQHQISKSVSASIDAELINANGKYSYRYTNGYYDTTVVRTNADIYAYRLEGGLYGNTKDLAKWNVKVYKYQSNRGVPGAIVSNKFSFNQRQWDDNFFVQTSYQNDLNKKINFLLNAKYANDYTRYNNPDIQSDKGALNNIYKQQEWYVSAAGVYHVKPRWDVSFSTDYSLQKLDANLEYFAYPTRNTGLFVLSGKYYIKRFDLQANILATWVNEKVKFYNAAGNRTEYTPAVMFSVQPFNTPNFRIKGFYKSIFRMPTFNDLYYTFVGNTQLRPEFTKQFDVGFNYQLNPESGALKQIYIQADAYYNQVKDKIVAVPTVNLFKWTMLNLDAVSIKGIEINAKTSWQINQLELGASLNYTYEKALDVTPTGFTYKNQIPYIPVHSGSLVMAGSYKNYGLNYSFIYTGERYSQKANIPVNYVEPYYTHDVALHRFFGKINQYKIALEINNLLNQHYDVVLNFPMPGRNYKINLKAKF